MISLAPFYRWESQGTNEAACFPRLHSVPVLKPETDPTAPDSQLLALITRKFLSSMAQPTGSNNKSKLLQRSSPFFSLLNPKKHLIFKTQVWLFTREGICFPLFICFFVVVVVGFFFFFPLFKGQTFNYSAPYRAPKLEALQPSLPHKSLSLL